MLLSCGSESQDPGDQGPECTEDWQCASGSCTNGTCALFTGDDTITGDPQDLASKDGVPDNDLTSPEDSVSGDEVKEVTTPGDTSVEDVPTTKPGTPGTDQDIGVYPSSYTFTYVPDVHNPTGTMIDIYNEGGAPLTIGKIYMKAGSSPEFTITALPPLPKTLAPFDQVAIMVMFQEKAPHTPAWLVIESNDPDEPAFEVELTSQSKMPAQPCIQVYPSALNFGQVERGQSKTMGFSITNCSDEMPLQVKDIKRSIFFGMTLSDEFQFTPNEPVTPFLIAANQKLNFEITYSPGLAGYDSGHFIFANNDPTSPEAKLTVTGTGVPPPLEKIGLHIELEWDTDNTDVDMHLLAPGGTFFDCQKDCYFSNMHPDWGVAGDYLDDPFLDYDDVDGYGPEHINMENPAPGTYKVLIHYYADNHDGMSGGASKPVVRVYSYGQLVQSFGPVTLSSTNAMWDVCNIDWPSVNITPLGNVYTVNSTPAGCFPF